jgi:tRNA/rRNA methyltransferase
MGDRMTHNGDENGQLGQKPGAPQAETILDTVRIVLVEPAGPRNVGAIARIMKNMGLSQLVVVNPHCAITGEEARMMAVHAVELLQQAVIVSSIPEALSGCARVVATAGRDRHAEAVPLMSPQQAVPWLLAMQPCALMFGPEDRGLNNAELRYAQHIVRIPSSDRYPSLNLAQAVAICSYELYAQTVNGDPMLDGAAPSTVPDDPAPFDALEQYYQDLETVLLQIGYLYPHTAESRMAKLRRLHGRAGISTQELAMLRGIIRQIRWAIASSDPRR